MITNPFHLIESNSPLERGKLLGKKLKSSILSLYELKSNLYPQTHFRKETVKNFIRNISIHTPTCFQELVGLSQIIDIPIEQLILLCFEYELWMVQSQNCNKCSGLVLTRPLILAQTNDEYPEQWLNGNQDVILHYRETNHAIIMYTHPGLPAYMGMNDKGITILWFYIDNGDRNFVTGVPTCALIRETLQMNTLSDSIDFLKKTPKCIPNCFILSDQYKSVVIECTPSFFFLKEIKDATYIHTNHILIDEHFSKQDIGLKREGNTSLARYEKLKQLVSPTCSISDIKNILSTPPIFNQNTLASMIFEPLKLKATIRLKEHFQEYSL